MLDNIEQRVDLRDAQATADSSVLQLLAKPAVFVPFPLAADDHQRVNAQALERQAEVLGLALGSPEFQKR